MLWRHATIDLDYPDGERYYHRVRSTRRRKAPFEPDGHVRVEITDKTVDPGTRDVFTNDDMTVQSFWMTHPNFGEWDELTDPEFGTAPTT
ncbi:hypothetical protein [Cellulomonas sp. HD19AZ1]|uniref:hypothetical protein n=1 Tax=Cellulomonas sp. HD19AZ1 TaxID=2559593 RepID=UPI0010713067|nr:hypothetical protein [Cellulomonas sp. HD19AZ1]TFH68202.1 hypothetical protein E4A51_16945 [Cellulomonas sp. HD19AZ1]